MLWIILFLPLASFALISLFLLRRHAMASGVSVGAAVAGALLALGAVSGAIEAPAPVTWLAAADLQVNIGFVWDGLAQLMTLIVTGVGALIHIYSLGYMREDPGKARYFGYLSLFMFSMLGIVFADNFVMLFIFWELVGLSSYLLIGFWFERPSAADAGKKAFLVNKLGDFGFMLGIILVWTIWRSVDFQTLSASSARLVTEHQASGFSSIPLAAVALLLFCGAVGKSAQFPLHVWLPDAMEGPTPVSALIHAATMVAAGVYMLCRIFFILSLAPEALEVISWVGAVTAILAALWAVAQDDIKRILAYSTLSQLGYMVMAVGLSGPASAMFHLTTHAFFKALLFMAAGSVIVALHHEQNIWRMGGLVSRMRVTAITFLVGLLALCGIPYSLSKDEILALAFQQNRLLFVAGAATAFLTALYMGRLFVVAFLGKSRDAAAEHARENGPVMTLPLCILAALSLTTVFHNGFIHESLRLMGGLHDAEMGGLLHVLLILIPLLGAATAVALYGNGAPADALEKQLPRLRRILASKFRFDEVYEWMVRNVQGVLAGLLRLLDDWIVDGLFVKGVPLAVRCVGNMVCHFQSGNLQAYVIYLALAMTALIYWGVIR
ncbi:MAG: NADH-quinone oxidoreductase subunit L [Verrucomicrobia bacterium]|nr:NADH-quinone oxidoreductase subunit L [Verrucomicrobiota bacterium]